MRRRLAAIYVISGMLSILVGTAIFLHLKEAVHEFDEKYLGGQLWTAVLGERLIAPAPVLDATYDWLPKARFFPIAHAMGEDGAGTINSISALERSYRVGFRFFEVDLSVTTDGKLICRHGDGDHDLVSLLEFTRENTARRDSACVFSDVVDAARRHSDAYFILDVKNRFEEAYKIIWREVADPRLGKRFIP